MDWEMEDEGGEETDWDDEWERCNVAWLDDIVTTSQQYDNLRLTEG